jgi:hypothetical protein
MGIRLGRNIVPSRNRVAAARSLAGLLGVSWRESGLGGFAAVYVNGTLTLAFADEEQFEPHHLCWACSKQQCRVPKRSHVRLLTDSGRTECIEASGPLARSDCTPFACEGWAVRGP